MNRTVPVKPFQPVGTAPPTRRSHRRVHDDPEKGRQAKLEALQRAREKRKGNPSITTPVSSESLQIAADRAIDGAADLISRLMSQSRTGHRQLSRLAGKDMTHVLHRLYSGRDVKLSTLAEIAHALGCQLTLAATPRRHAKTVAA